MTFRDFADHPGQISSIDWLHQIGVAPCGERFFSGEYIEKRGHGDDGNVAGLRIGLQLADERQTVHPRQHQVEQNSVGFFFLDRRECLFGCLGLAHFVAGRGQHQPGEFQVGRIVLDYENFYYFLSRQLLPPAGRRLNRANRLIRLCILECFTEGDAGALRPGFPVKADRDGPAAARLGAAN
jgi:hypothetical protein